MNQMETLNKGIIRAFEYIAYGCLSVGGIGMMGFFWSPGMLMLNESGQEFYKYLLIGSLVLIGFGVLIVYILSKIDEKKKQESLK